MSKIFVQNFKGFAKGYTFPELFCKKRYNYPCSPLLQKGLFLALKDPHHKFMLHLNRIASPNNPILLVYLIQYYTFNKDINSQHQLHSLSDFAGACIKRIDGPVYQIRAGSPRCRLTLSANKWPHSQEVVERLGLFFQSGMELGWGWRHTSEGQMGAFIRNRCAGVTLKSSSER